MLQISSLASDLQNPRVRSPFSETRAAMCDGRRSTCRHRFPVDWWFKKPTPRISSLASDVWNPRSRRPSSASRASTCGLKFCRRRSPLAVLLRFRRTHAFFLHIYLKKGLLLLLFLKTQIANFLAVGALFLHMSLIILKLEVLKLEVTLYTSQ